MLTLLQLLQELELQPMRGAASGKRRCIDTPGQHASPLTMYCNATISPQPKLENYNLNGSQNLEIRLHS